MRLELFQLQHLLLTLAEASPLQPVASPGVLHFDATIRPKTGLNKRSAIKDSFISAITIPLYVGSNNEEVPVNVDTGSYLSWFHAGFYNHTKSTTAHKLGDPFVIHYAAGWNVTGWNYNDTVSNRPSGSDGVYVGFGLAEAGYMYDIDFSGLIGLNSKHEGGFDLIGQFLNAGYITSRSFSFWIPDSNHGSVTFGGVDVSRVASEFTKVPISFQNAIDIFVQKFKAERNGQEIIIAEGNQYSCALDTGSDRTYLPSALYYTFLHAFGAVPVKNSTEAQAAGLSTDFWAINYQGGTLKYESCGFDVEVPLWRYLADKDLNQLDSEPENGGWYSLFMVESDSCTLDFQTVFEEYVIAFDMDNHAIGFASMVAATGDEDGPGSLSVIGSDGISGAFAPSTELGTIGTDFTVYSSTTFSV